MEQQNEKTEYCFFYHIKVTVVDGKCTEDCIMEDCALVDDERIRKQSQGKKKAEGADFY